LLDPITQLSEKKKNALHTVDTKLNGIWLLALWGQKISKFSQQDYCKPTTIDGSKVSFKGSEIKFPCP
jgi:hypothetical protein